MHSPQAVLNPDISMSSSSQSVTTGSPAGAISQPSLASTPVPTQSPEQHGDDNSADDDEDAQQQDEELVALASIFPDSLRVLPLPPEHMRRHGHIGVQVELPADGLCISLAPANGSDSGADSGQQTIVVHSLPPIVMHFALPPTYPSTARPRIKLTSDWAPPPLLATLSATAHSTADACLTYGSVSLFDIHTDVVNALDTYVSSLSTLHVASQEALDAIHRHDQARKLAALERTPYTCLICLDPRPGRDAVLVPGCGHRFCRQCLVDFFTVLINEGMPKQVRCPHPDCPRGDEPTSSLLPADPESDARAKPAIDPVQSAQSLLAAHPIQPTFLSSLLGAALATKFTDQFLARAYASDPAMHWCPRPTCGGPARGHLSGPYAKLATCLRCHFAFCVYCSRAWHGSAQACRVANASAVVQAYLAAMALPSEREREAKLLPLYVQYGRSVVERLAREHAAESETREWIKANVTPCPQCRQGVSRSAGCAHMTCSACGAHFCFNCGASLAHLQNPYKHYSTQGLQCYNRLFEGVETAEQGGGGGVADEPLVVWDDEAGQAIVLF